MNKTLKSLIGLAGLLALGLSGCGPAPAPMTANPAAPAKLKVIATFSILGDLVQNVAGDKVDLVTLVGPEGDTHDYEPVPSDSAALANAALIFENGLGFEAWLDKLYAASGAKAARVITAAGVTTRQNGGAGAAETDPHVWQNVENAVQMVKNIEAGLSRADAANAAFYKANAEAYRTRLAALDSEVKAEVDKLPKDRRKLVTSHDALGYFADRYGFEIVGSVIASVSTEAGEPSARDFARIVDAIKTTGTKAIFLESVSNPALVERVAKEAGVTIGPELYTDSLGKPDSPGATYIDAIRHNAQSLVSALGS